jgi:mannose-1-phosphate guanylyltransferase
LPLSSSLLLAAGFGTRLRPLTHLRAKPALPVAGEALVRRILGWLAAEGVTDAVLNLHHRPETVCAAVGDGRDLGVRVRYSWENPVLGSAGGPRRALPLLAVPRFFIVNGDTLTDLALEGLAAEHDRTGALVTLAVVPNRAPEQYGGVLVSDEGEVRGFTGRGSTAPSWHFIGVQAAEAVAFESLPDGEPAESVGGLYPALIRSRPGSVRAYRCHAAFSDIGTPADYLRTSLALAAGAAGPSPLVGARAQLADSARVENTILWDDVQVGAGARLAECIVADGVRVPPGVNWTRRIAIAASDARVDGAGERVGSAILFPVDR